MLIVDGIKDGLVWSQHPTSNSMLKNSKRCSDGTRGKAFFEGRLFQIRVGIQISISPHNV